MYYFSKTSIGYSHTESGKVCQDFSASYHDEERTIVSVCDGHGGKIYVRSQLGSRFACMSIFRVFQEIPYSVARGKISEEYLNKIRLSILCEWNAFVEKHYADHPFRHSETEDLCEEEKRKLKAHPERAYGTTLIGAMKLGNKLFVAHLGDGESLLLRKGAMNPVFQEDEDEPVANVTYSMCAEDAYNHLKVAVIDFNDFDGIVLCTDGVVNPYQNYPNFLESMVKPLVHDVITTKKTDGIADFVTNLGSELGIGDDVSLAFIIKEGCRDKYYKGKEE